MSEYCFSCPNKEPLKKSWFKCKNCSKCYHESCATRAKISANGVIKKCCKEEFLIDFEINGPAVDSLITEDNLVNSISPSRSDNSVVNMATENQSLIWMNFGRSLKTKLITLLEGSYRISPNTDQHSLQTRQADHPDQQTESHLETLSHQGLHQV